MNEHFVSVGPSLAKKISFDMSDNVFDTYHYITYSNVTFHFTLVDTDEVMKIILNFSNDKATGCDMLSVKLIKLAANGIVNALTHIINISLMIGNVPDIWKRARVTALHKGGSNEVSNFRPISVLPILSKVLERIAFNQLYDFLNINCLINKYQSGFRPMHSTTTALLNITDDWLIEFDKGNIVIAVMLDLKGAFDTIDHETLIRKLYYYGLDEISVNWFKSYLHGRFQATCVSGNTSDFRPVTCGIPQGSILGPLLFILHINDLPSVVKHCKVSMYADDTMLYCSGKDPFDICRKINEDLENIRLWLIRN